MVRQRHGNARALEAGAHAVDRLERTLLTLHLSRRSLDRVPEARDAATPAVEDDNTKRALAQ